MALNEINPATRLEMFLQGIADGQNDEEPATRKEEFLDRIADRLNTIYNYEPVIPDPTGADVNKVMTVVAATSDDPAKWEAKLPLCRPGENPAGSVIIDQSDPGESGGGKVAPKATNKRALAFGANSTASGLNSIAAGDRVTASGQSAIAIGAYQGSVNTLASGANALAFGGGVIASGTGSIATGTLTEANASYSQAHGLQTKSTGRGCFVIGVNNIPDDNPVDATHGAGARKYLFIIGNSTYNGTPSNALTVDWDGNLVCNNIPAPPTTDGTYKLTCTITSGTPAFTWEAVTP